MSPPLLAITAQAAAMSVFSSLLAQALTAYKTGTPLALDWAPVVKFVVFALVTTAPNVLWQAYLECTFPGTHETHETEKKKATATLDITNTVIKTALDQTVGASVNTVLFCVFMGAWAVLVDDAPTAIGTAVADALQKDFVALYLAGLKFWPFVSVGNFALVSDVATRNLVGGLAGIVWGVYVNLVAAE